MDEGIITEDQHSRILEIQRKKLKTTDPITKRSKESILFGKLVVRKGFLTEAQVNECLRKQAEQGGERSLGEVMVASRYLSPAHVKSVLSEQLKRIMSCPKCGLSFTVLSTTRRKRVGCPRCMGPLQEGKPSDSIRTDAEIGTLIAQNVECEREPPSALTRKRAYKELDVNCKVCSHAFRAFVDPTSRVSCPSCLSRFVVA